MPIGAIIIEGAKQAAKETAKQIKEAAKKKLEEKLKDPSKGELTESKLPKKDSTEIKRGPVIEDVPLRGDPVQDIQSTLRDKLKEVVKQEAKKELDEFVDEEIVDRNVASAATDVAKELKSKLPKKPELQEKKIAEPMEEKPVELPAEPQERIPVEPREEVSVVLPEKIPMESFDKTETDKANEVSEKKFPSTPENNGHWEGERGNSKWVPDGDYVPPEQKPGKPYSNPDNLSWKEIMDKYGIDGINFKDGFPDFSEVSKGTVEIEGFETGGNSEKYRNFKKADAALAEQKGCSPAEVEKWRKEHNYTWHECEDKKTMMKVPNEVHANVKHDGGRSQKD